MSVRDRSKSLQRAYPVCDGCATSPSASAGWSTSRPVGDIKNNIKCTMYDV